jgi:lysyl-tRNA synthetase class 2
MWRPTASSQNLKKRAELLYKIRQFFHQRGVTEVETPLMASAPVTDAFIQALTTECRVPGGLKKFYLQTSPEYAMKRLLAAEVGSIYQICKAFRDDEVGSRHNPEFTMLEWYRLGFTDFDLMQEMDDLLQLTLNCEPAEYLSYQQAFLRHLNINPHIVDLPTLRSIVLQYIGEIPNFTPTRDDYLHLLMSEVIEPQLGQERPSFIYNYPASQAALARRRMADDIEVAARFEVYVKGVELANGYYELTNAEEQYNRFIDDLAKRHALGMPIVPIDEYLMAAMRHGLPNCAGVALGIDRLCMLALGAQSLEEVIAFPLTRA